jgi:hypothetical protein
MNEPSLIPADWKLPTEFRERLGTSVGRQRTMSADGQLLIVLHEAPERGESTRRGVLFWRDTNGQWLASNGRSGHEALHQHLESYAKKIEEYFAQESRAQRADEYIPLVESLAPISRAARNMLTVLDEARDIIRGDRVLIDYRDKAYEISRNAELLYDDLKNSMEIAVIRRAEEQAAASHRMAITAHRLNVMAALFFPLATLGAIFGTTLTDNWSWADSPLPFGLFVAIGLLAGVLLAMRISRSAT